MQAKRGSDPTTTICDKLTGPRENRWPLKKRVITVILAGSVGKIENSNIPGVTIFLAPSQTTPPAPSYTCESGISYTTLINFRTRC